MNKSALMLEINIPAPGLRPGAGFLHAYTESLIKEIENCSAELAEYDIKSLYIRGASGPGDLDLRVLTRTLKQKLDIADAEKVIEMEPERVTTANMSTYQNFRTSLYRFNLKSLNYSDFRRMKLRYEYNHYTWIRKLLSYSSMTNICTDLLLGIPGQTSSSMKDSLNRALSFDPDKICLIPADPDVVPNDDEKQERTEDSEDQRLQNAARILDEADAYLAENGYQKSSVYEYAKPNMDSAHTLLQCTDCEYWGLGVGAVSFMDGCILTNTSNPDAYISAQGDPEKILSKAVRLDAKSLMINRAVRELNSAKGLDTAGLEADFGDGLKENFEELSDRGFAEEKDGKLVLTSLGAVSVKAVQSIMSKSRV